MNTKINEQEFLKAESSMLFKRITSKQASEVHFWKTRTYPGLFCVYTHAFEN